MKFLFYVQKATIFNVCEFIFLSLKCRVGSFITSMQRLRDHLMILSKLMCANCICPFTVCINNKS